MKNFKKIALGLIVGAMAIGFSAFTSANNSRIQINRNAAGKVLSVTSTYFRVPANASTSTDLIAAHYIFSDNEDADCEGVTSNICSSRWTTTNAPQNGDSPVANGSPSFQGDNSAQGVYNGL